MIEEDDEEKELTLKDAIIRYVTSFRSRNFTPTKELMVRVINESQSLNRLTKCEREWVAKNHSEYSVDLFSAMKYLEKRFPHGSFCKAEFFFNNNKDKIPFSREIFSLAIELLSKERCDDRVIAFPKIT